MSELDFSTTMSEAFDKATSIEAPAVEVAPVTESPDPAPVKAAAETVTETPDQGTTKEGEPAIAQPIEPPSRWSAEDKAEFATLSPEAQKLVLKRESDVEKHLTQKSQEFAEKTKSIEPLEQILATREQAWAMNGMTKVQAVNQLLAISDYASANPEAFIREFAKGRGIDLTQAVTNEGETYVDPQIAAIQQELQATRQQIQQRDQQQNEAIINSFKAEAGHEHFDDVRLHMAALLQAGKAKDMNDAYDQAVWANPETRGKLLAAQQSAAETKRLEEAKEAAAKAKKAAGTRVNGSSSVPVLAAQGQTFKETMSMAYDNLHGSAA